MKPDISSLPEWSRPWAERRLVQVFHDISREQWNGLGDWLTALPTERPKMPAKLYKLTMEQALQASARWHEDIARHAYDKSSFGGDPSAVQVLADGGQGWRWVRVTSSEGLDYEGNAMGHCVGRGGYDTAESIYLNGCTGLTSLPSDLNLGCRVIGGDHLISRNHIRA